MELLKGMVENCGETNISLYPERQRILIDIISKKKPKKIIEIGFNEGHSAKIICDTICKLKQEDEDYLKTPIVFLVFDICKYECTTTNFNIIAEHYKGWNIFMNLIPGDSRETLPRALSNFNENFDFIEIDGCNSRECVEADLKNVLFRLNKNGFVYLNDFNSSKNPTIGVDETIRNFNWDGFEFYHTDGLFWAEKKELNIPKSNEFVNHPKHYGGEENPYEAIKVIDAWELGFALGNTVKYISRAGKKDPKKELEDLKKAMWYLQHHISKLEN